MRRAAAVSALALAALVGSPHAPATAAPVRSATIRRIVDGQQVYIDKRQARTGQEATSGQVVSTGSSRAELLFDKRALGFLGRDSLITIGSQCFRLQKGSVLVNGTQSGCMGSRILGVRGTTYVLSSTADGDYDLSVLVGEVTVGEQDPAAAPPADGVNILSKYPTLSPWIGFGPSAWGSNAAGVPLGQAAGLILGDLELFVPLMQKEARTLLYGYSTATTNFDGAWGTSAELGYTWFDSRNQSSTTLFAGYDGFSSPGSECFNNQVALGGQWERSRWQFGANGSIPVAVCPNSLGVASLRVGIPIVNLGEQSVILSLSPYLLAGLGENYAGGRIGLGVPVNEHIDLSLYGQYDPFLNTVVGGKVSYRFSPNGRFVRDPNIPPRGSQLRESTLSQGFSSTRPFQLALGRSSGSSPAAGSMADAPVSDAGTGLISQAGAVVLKAGEQARFNADGFLISRGRLSRNGFVQLTTAALKGQNPMPEGRAVVQSFESIYGETASTDLMDSTGSSWLVSSRQPFPRPRADQNLVVPQDRLPKERASSYEQSGSGNYVCRYQTTPQDLYYTTSSGSFSTSSLSFATFYFADASNPASCAGKQLNPGSGFVSTSVYFVTPP